MASKKPNPLPLSETLRDLALLRAADCDLSSILASAATPPSDSERSAVDKSVELSYTFAKEARAVIRLQNREEVEKQGEKLEEVRAQLEDVLVGLGQSRPS